MYVERTRIARRVGLALGLGLLVTGWNMRQFASEDRAVHDTYIIEQYRQNAAHETYLVGMWLMTIGAVFAGASAPRVYRAPPSLGLEQGD